jgi:hypothetical protein
MEEGTKVVSNVAKQIKVLYGAR